MKYHCKVSELNDEIVAIAMVDMAEMPEPQVKVRPLQQIDCFQVAFWCCVAFCAFGILLTWMTWR